MNIEKVRPLAVLTSASDGAPGAGEDAETGAGAGVGAGSTRTGSVVGTSGPTRWSPSSVKRRRSTTLKADFFSSVMSWPQRRGSWRSRDETRRNETKRDERKQFKYRKRHKRGKYEREKRSGVKKES
jgi:hypothetical protein